MKRPPTIGPTAIAIAVGPIVGGLFTTYLSWRYVFAGEVLVVIAILALAGRMEDGPKQSGVRLDLVGTALSALGLGMIVFGILRSGTWGFVKPKPGAPEWLGLSPVIWLILGGACVIWLFLAWENRVIARGGEPLIDLKSIRNPVLRGGLTAFFFQYFVQGGMFFAVPLFLSVALGLSAIETGVRLLPLSLTLIIAAAGIPRFFPQASPRRVARIGFGALFVGLTVFVGALDAGAGAEIVTGPMLIAGVGVGCLASQLGSITVSSVSDEHSDEVGGLQNTITNLGISVGTALTGAIVMAALTTSFLADVQQNPAVPESVKTQATTELSGGAPFVSDAELEAGLKKANVPPEATSAIIDANEKARLDGLRTAMAVLALMSIVGLLFSGWIPAEQPGSQAAASPRGDPVAGAAPA